MINDKSWFSKLNLYYLAELVAIIAIILSGFIIFTYERKQNNPDYQKSWVAFYFADPNSPQKGVVLENHLGADTEFAFCLVPDSDDLMEPADLSCSIDTAKESVTKNITAGNSDKWLYTMPDESNRYWIIAEYLDRDNVKKSKDLSFEIK